MLANGRFSMQPFHDRRCHVRKPSQVFLGSGVQVDQAFTDLRGSRMAPVQGEAKSNDTQITMKRRSMETSS